MTRRRALMLVSDRVDEHKRSLALTGGCPLPEYLVLEQDYGVDLLDWSQLPGRWPARSRTRSILHVMAAVRRAGRYDVIFSDGEHVGIPLAVAKRALGLRPAHVVIAHHLTTPRKARAFEMLHARLGISALVVHSPRQRELAESMLGVSQSRLEEIPYGVDPEFWRPQAKMEEPLIVAAGREHRDYSTLAAACADLPIEVFVAGGSRFAPGSSWSAPATWPPNFTCRRVDYQELRDTYARAQVVVIPVLQTDFQAGITSVLEAMAMGKAVVTTRTEGRQSVVREGYTGVLVPPGDPWALREAVSSLLRDPAERARLGANARRAVLDCYSVQVYSRRLAGALGLASDEPRGATASRAAAMGAG
jgi:glycosyltransferase involved in cell wall biosynthesis